MRTAAQRTMDMQDLQPANGTVYMPSLGVNMKSMMQALLQWERRRGLASLAFKDRMGANKTEPQKPKKSSSREKAR
jgi:hypothetical protein